MRPTITKNKFPCFLFLRVLARLVQSRIAVYNSFLLMEGILSRPRRLQHRAPQDLQGLRAHKHVADSGGSAPRVGFQPCWRARQGGGTAGRLEEDYGRVRGDERMKTRDSNQDVV